MNMQQRTVTVATRGKRNGHTNTRLPPSAVLEAANALFKKTEPDAAAPLQPQPVPTPTAPKPEHLVSISISERHVKFRIAKHLWEQIGRPARIDVTGTPSSGFQIRPGKKIKIIKSGTRAIVFDAFPSSIGVGHTNRPAEHLQATVISNYIQIEKLSWATSEPEQKPDPIDTEKHIVHAAEAAVERELEIGDEYGGVCVRANGAGFQLVFKIAETTMEEIGKPKRIIVTGTCQQGFTITPTDDDREGVKVYYDNGGRNIYIMRGISDLNLSKVGRKYCPVRVSIDNGVIKIGGPTYEWIRGLPVWLRDTKDNGHHVEPASQQVNGPGFQVSNNAETQRMIAEIAQLLLTVKPVINDARQKLRDLQERTGLKLVIKGDMTLAVDMGMLAPNELAGKPEIPITNGHRPSI